MIAHFVVSSVEGSLIALCGTVIHPRDTQGAKVGIYGQICKPCEVKVKEAWVTLQSRS
jgi:hypothetical protein